MSVVSALLAITSPSRRTCAAASVAVALALGLTACGSSSSGSSDHAAAPGVGHHDSAMPMPGMAAMATGDGLASAQDGYAFTSATTTLPAGKEVGYRFTISGPNGKPVTGFAVDQTKRLHFYAVRSDLTGFQHTHPTMAADGTWTAGLAALRPGSWRLFAQFTPDSGPGGGQDFVLSRTVTVPGTASTTALPAPASSATADGYTVTVNGTLRAAVARSLTVTITRDGRSVTDLQPYLSTYAHLTAFHQGDQAFAHLHPTNAVDGDHGGPALTFNAELPKSGDWRLFLQFQTAGTLHTAAITLHAG
ncbi:hypothetical protein NGB36_14085 [Streptomyces sp. RB6PN25]|uniref:Uncharacterized protein n=1 Tax=Streptomyces humicola TaxID=2953240 RepID=A0ABT1PVL5_9ACTN|nr:hypothetical protein [Streptomyces humicola]MCQ4081706.1 hypothetical protein [Streptomyces humicola]